MSEKKFTDQGKFKYIIDENDNKIAVQVDIDLFEAIQPFIEDYGLARAIEEAQNEETVSFEEAIKLLSKNDTK